MPTLTVETGTGSSSSNCYISYADANAYFLARGIDAWAAATQTDREEAIIRGAQYLENTYRLRWIGSRANRDQALAWPRRSSVWGYGDSVGYLTDQDGWYINQNEVPSRVASANAEAALLVIQAVDLEPRLERGGAVISQTDKAGPVSTSVTYASGASERDRITAIDGYLSGLITSSLSVPMVRG